MLLFDAGNTRVKWAILSEDGSLSCFGYAPHQDLAALHHFLQSFRPKSIHGVAVCSEERRNNIEKICPIPVQWQRNQNEALGVIHYYKETNSNGVDRWFNVLGARGFNKTDPLLIVSCGTAVVIDSLTADNKYLGGSILPGVHMMYQSLTSGTAQIQHSLGNYQNFAQNTSDAILTGITDAICGAIERQHTKFAAYLGSKESIKIILTGGGAPTIYPFLDKNAQNIDNLVLHGLARWVIQK